MGGCRRSRLLSHEVSRLTEVVRASRSGLRIGGWWLAKMDIYMHSVGWIRPTGSCLKKASTDLSLAEYEGIRARLRVGRWATPGQPMAGGWPSDGAPTAGCGLAPDAKLITHRAGALCGSQSRCRASGPPNPCIRVLEPEDHQGDPYVGKSRKSPGRVLSLLVLFLLLLMTTRDAHVGLAWPGGWLMSLSEQVQYDR